MNSKKCRVCGETFVPKSSRQLDCNKIVTKICVICGNTFEGKCSINDTSTTCSKECSQKLAARNRVKSIQQTTRKCILCGKEFHPISTTQKYCKQMHEVNCEFCGKPFITDVSKSDRRRTCSDNCKVKLSVQNTDTAAAHKKSLKSYKDATGYDHPMHNPDVVEKMKMTNLARYGDTSFRRTADYVKQTQKTSRARYGTDWPMQNQDLLDKRAKTVLHRYGVENVMQLPEFVDNYTDSMIKKYGVAWPLQSPEIQLKVQTTMYEKYGAVSSLSIPEIKSKQQQTMIDRYDVPYALQDPKILAQVKQTNLAKYGSECYLSSEDYRSRRAQYMLDAFGESGAFSQKREWKEERVTDPAKLDEWMKFLEDPDQYISNIPHKPTYRELENLFGVTASTISEHIHKYNLVDKIKYTYSSGEDEIIEYLYELNSDLNIIRHERTLIKGYELDLYIPDYQLAIEYNPTVTHNSSFFDPWGGYPKLPGYHKHKTDLCENQGIFLFHIFGYEWIHKQPIIKSMIRNVLGYNQHKIYARKCIVKQLSSKECKGFLNQNHRQGNANSPIRYGLYHNNELVSVMTFGHPRVNIGKSTSEHENTYELVRFCSKLNTSVIGGANKLFQHFLRCYDPKEVYSFSDRAHTRGNMYSNLGFSLVDRYISPGYMWVDTKTDIAYSRSQTQKHNLVKFLKDTELDLSKTERQIMIEHGFAQVYDSGSLLWRWDR